MAEVGASRLEQLLHTELVRAGEFVALLREEQATLTSGAHDDLEALAAKKAAGAEELGRLAAERDAILVDLSLSTGKAGMERWLASPAGVRSQDNWQRLLRTASEARALNEANGKIIAVRLQSNQQALAALTAASDKTATYGPDGHQHSNLGKRSLGSI